MNITFQEAETIRKHAEFKMLLSKNGLSKLVPRIERMEAAYDTWKTSDQYKIPAFHGEIEEVGNMMRQFYGEGSIN